jgi:putative methyltransferase
MSLYQEAASAIQNSEGVGGSLKSRIYGNKKTKNTPPQIYALLSQTIKWSPILKPVIEVSGLLTAERKVSRRF